MAGIEVLRTRADETGEKTGNEELRILRQKVEKLNNAQEKTEATMNEMKAQMDKLKKKADEEKEKRDKAMKQLRAVITENGLLKGKMEELRKKHAQEMERAKAIALNPPELMEVEIMPVSPTAETTRTTSTPTSPVRTLPTTRELKEWPAFRPPIRGKTMRIPETQCFTSRDLPSPPEVEEIRKSSKVSKKRRKGEGGVAWNEMELCSTTTIEKERREVQEAHEGSSTREGGRAGRLEPSRTPPTLAPRPQSKGSGTGAIRQTAMPPSTIPRRKAPPPPPQREKNRASEEEKKRRKRERRRIKRQEEARKRAEARARGEDPPRSRRKDECGEKTESGPASRTRAKTRTMTDSTMGVPKTRPLSAEARIEDVPVPPDGWTLVKGRRGGGAADGSKSREQGTYANIAAKIPAQGTSRGTAQKPRGRAPTIIGQQQQRQQGRQQGTGRQSQQQQQRQPTFKRPPKTATIQVACPPGQCAETMRLARERVNIRSLGIEELRPRRARTGALLLEIPGANGATKADALAREMREALQDREGVIISRPIKTAEIRVKDLEDSISADEVAQTVADSGECQVGDVRVGPVRKGTNGLGTIWVRCPLIAANRLIRKGHLKLGWTRSRVELLPERQTSCFKCLQVGHVRATCPNEADRSDVCYRCGVSGHLARNCANTPQCPLCTGTRRPANHRVGSQACKAPRRKERRGEGGATTNSSTPLLMWSHQRKHHNNKWSRWRWRKACPGRPHLNPRSSRGRSLERNGTRSRPHPHGPRSSRSWKRGRGQTRSKPHEPEVRSLERSGVPPPRKRCFAKYWR